MKAVLGQGRSSPCQEISAIPYIYFHPPSAIEDDARSEAERTYDLGCNPSPRIVRLDSNPQASRYTKRHRFPPLPKVI